MKQQAPLASRLLSSALCLMILSACAPAPAQTLAPAPLAQPTEQSTGDYPPPSAAAEPTTGSYPPPASGSEPTAGPTTDSYPAAPTETANSPQAQPTLVLPTITVPFDEQRAYQDLEYQMSLGPRTPGSPAHDQVIDWMKTELAKNGWTVEIQETTQNDQLVRNVIAKRGTGAPWTILGAHFDSRMKADQDPDPAKQGDPVPGANDGASGVAVLMELARVLPKDMNGQVWLAFFDSEDQGQLPGWDWILGSRALANSLTGKPDSVIIVDMIGDADLNVYQEKNSDPTLTNEIWSLANQLGYGQAIIAEPKFSMLDDHTPFLEKGIRAIDMIDFDYPYWHTTGDTADKVSPRSLKIIGDTLLNWLVATQGQ